ncbi:class I SAM-dependent methyltransferase [Candidatus Saccharibacteria bacterium]|nr:class I SAM-dependent methyltransferase [Candidatus Saccharibacteria bacterium]
MAKTKIHKDYERLADIRSDEQRRVTAISISKPFGKLCYAIGRFQLIPWKSYPVALKMLIMYLAAKDYFIQEGLPKRLVELATDALGGVGGKPLETKLRNSILFVGAAWHIRFVRAYKLLLEEFKAGRNVESYGCGSGIIEIIALIASGNASAKLTLIDYDSVGIDLARQLVALFRDNGYDISSQVSISEGDICECKPSSETNTIVSIGLLHNYFTLEEANAMMREWFETGVSKVITDIYYDADIAENGSNDAKLRLSYVRIVCGWKVGLPDGLLYCNREDFCKSLANYNVEVYDHSLNATLVVRQ